MTARRSDKLALGQTLRDIRCTGKRRAQAISYPRFLFPVRQGLDHEERLEGLSLARLCRDF
jgi:hypothetical protein